MPLELADAAPSAALTSVAASATSVSLLGANNARKGVVAVNDSTATLYLAYAATASTTAYTVAVPGSSGGVLGYWEMPQPIYTGAIAGIWSSATGNVRLTEI